jgi:hypothetical protein
MIKLSDHDIDELLHSFDFVYKLSSGIRKRESMIVYLRDHLKLFLNGKQSGTRENVCQKCLGTGYRD